jgi:hypothetical protein
MVIIYVTQIFKFIHVFMILLFLNVMIIHYIYIYIYIYIYYVLYVFSYFKNCHSPCSTSNIPYLLFLFSAVAASLCCFVCFWLIFWHGYSHSHLMPSCCHLQVRLARPEIIPIPTFC